MIEFCEIICIVGSCNPSLSSFGECSKPDVKFNIRFKVLSVVLRFRYAVYVQKRVKKGPNM